MEQVQYISDENNNITGVIVPIDFWKKIQLKTDWLSEQKISNGTETGDRRKPSRNFGKMRDKVKIVGDIVSPVSDENEWEVLGR